MPPRNGAALRVQPRVALAEADEVGLHAVGDAEIEMAAVHFLQERCRAQILVAAFPIDISPEIAGIVGDVRFAGQIGAAFGEGRGEAEVEAEQGRFRGGSPPGSGRRPWYWAGWERRPCSARRA